MSLPREILDQLLSGYLDDALSADERARVEQLLRDDPDVARELEELRRLSGTMRAIFLADRDIKLEAGFADRVLDNAVARATAEGLSDDHPLIQLAAQPAVAAEPKSTISWRVVTAMLALAASLAVAFVAFRGDPGPVDVDPERIANVPPVNPIDKPDQPIVDPSKDPGEERIANVEPGTDQDVAPERIAENSVTNGTDVPGRNDVKAPHVADVAPGSDAVVDNSANTPMREDPNRGHDRGQPLEVHLVGVGPVLVLNVRLTDVGRESKAITNAMRLASIDSGKEKEITDKVVAYISDSVERADDDPVTVLYLEAPAKQLDVFYLGLVKDVEGVESIGLTIAMVPPLMKVIQSIQSVDPTQIRHGVSWQLQSESPRAIDALARMLENRKFFDSRKENSIPPMAQDNGPDEMGRVLVLVRQAMSGN